MLGGGHPKSPSLGATPGSPALSDILGGGGPTPSSPVYQVRGGGHPSPTLEAAISNKRASIHAAAADTHPIDVRHTGPRMAHNAQHAATESALRAAAATVESTEIQPATAGPRHPPAYPAGHPKSPTLGGSGSPKLSFAQKSPTIPGSPSLVYQVRGSAHSHHQPSPSLRSPGLGAGSGEVAEIDVRATGARMAHGAQHGKEEAARRAAAAGVATTEVAPGTGPRHPPVKPAAQQQQQHAHESAPAQHGLGLGVDL